MATLKWIGLRPERKGEMQQVSMAEVNDFGLVGDHYSKEKGDRNVTIIKAESVEEVWQDMQLEGSPDPGKLRRNLLIEGLPDGDFKEVELSIGNEVILIVTGDCRPCSRMDQNLGGGGLQAMSGKGGYTAKVEKGGMIQIGDEVHFSKVKPRVVRHLP